MAAAIAEPPHQAADLQALRLSTVDLRSAVAARGRRLPPGSDLEVMARRKRAWCQRDYRVRFVTAAGLVTTLVEAQQQCRLARKLGQFARFDVVYVD